MHMNTTTHGKLNAGMYVLCPFSKGANEPMKSTINNFLIKINWKESKI